MRELMEPVFEQRLVEDHREDGYYIEALDIDGDGRPDLVAYGLGKGGGATGSRIDAANAPLAKIRWYKNPDWTGQTMTELLAPVGMHHADIDGDGRQDIVICHNYGYTIEDPEPDGGIISWLENPGPGGGAWRAHYIGRATTMHRLKIGHFTQDRTLEVLALPVVGRPHDVHSTTPILLFRQPPDVRRAWQWEGTRLDDEDYHVIHGVCVKRFGLSQGADLDSVLLASQEGITWLHYSPREGRWRRDLIGAGEPASPGTEFFGSGDVDAGRIGDDAFAYIPAIEPFHGSTVAVYCKDTAGSLLDVKWRRVVLDVYGAPNERGEGTGHFVICADFDGDGDDELLVGLRGPAPYQGVYYYKAVDASRGLFAKWKISDTSVARIAVADFDGDGRLDFATIGYSVRGYFETENPQLNVFYNRFGLPRGRS